MNTDNPNELISFWQSHIKQWQSSSLSQATYCKENDLIVHRFGYWKRKHEKTFVQPGHASI